MPLLAQQLPTAKPINLLQGRYAPQNTRAVGWQRMASGGDVCSPALVGLHVAGKGAELYMLKRAEKTVDASIDQAFRAAMPGEQNTINARRRMEQKLVAAAQRRRWHGPSPGARRARRSTQARCLAPRVQAMSYRDGALELKMAAPDADSLDRVSQALRGKRLGGGPHRRAMSSGQGYEGRIQIRPRGTS